MRLVRVGCLGLLLVLFVGYGVIVSLPVQRNAPIVTEGLAAARQRQAALRPRLKDPAQNGFLEPRLEPYWGKGRDNDGPVKSAVAAWLAYSYQQQGKPIQHHPLLIAKDPAYIAARAGFKAYIPDLVQAFSKPVFQPVVEDLIDPSALLQESSLPALTMAMNTYAESLVAEGKPEQAALMYQLALMEGQKSFEEVGTPQLMRGVSLQGLAFQSLVAYLSPGARLNAMQWAGFSAAVAAASPTPITVNQAVQNDLAFGVEFLNRPRASYDGDARPLRGLFLLPGFRGRELRVYQNYMARVLAESSKLRFSGGLPSPGLGASLLGSSGPGVRLLALNYDQQMARVTLHMAKMTGLAGSAAVCAYRAKYGAPPATLAELDKLGLKAPGGTPWSAAQSGLVYKVTGDRAELGVPVDPEVFKAAGIDTKAAQAVEEANSVYFGVRAQGVLFKI